MGKVGLKKKLRPHATENIFIGNGKWDNRAIGHNKYCEIDKKKKLKFLAIGFASARERGIGIRHAGREFDLQRNLRVFLLNDADVPDVEQILKNARMLTLCFFYHSCTCPGT